jgi:hypothetical protein
MSASVTQMLVENLAYHASPERLSIEEGFCINLPHGRVEVEQLDDTRAILGWVGLPKEIEGHNVGTRLVTEAAIECIRRGSRLLIASAMNPGALKIVAKVFGEDNLNFYEDVPGSRNADNEVVGWTPIPVIYEQAMWSSCNLARIEQELIDSGKQNEADDLNTLIRLAINLSDQNVIDSVSAAKNLYVPVAN